MRGVMELERTRRHTVTGPQSFYSPSNQREDDQSFLGNRLQIRWRTFPLRQKPSGFRSIHNSEPPVQLSEASG